MQDELGSQKLLVKNHCSTNQWANGFEDPRRCGLLSGWEMILLVVEWRFLWERKILEVCKILKSDVPWCADLPNGRPGKQGQTLNFNYLNYYANPQIVSRTGKMGNRGIESRCMVYEFWERHRMDFLPGFFTDGEIISFLPCWILRSLCPTRCRHIRCWIRHLPMETATFRISVLGRHKQMETAGHMGLIFKDEPQRSIFGLTTQGIYVKYCLFNCRNIWGYTQGEPWPCSFRKLDIFLTAAGPASGVLPRSLAFWRTATLTVDHLTKVIGRFQWVEKCLETFLNLESKGNSAEKTTKFHGRKVRGFLMFLWVSNVASLCAPEVNPIDGS